MKVLKEFKHHRSQTKACQNTWLGALILIIIALCLGGCSNQNREAGQSVAVTGAATSQVMATHFDTLADMVEGQAMLEDLFIEIQDPTIREGMTPITQTEKELYKRQAAALRRRERLSREMAQLYTALAELSNYDAPSKVNTAVGGLLDSVTVINAEAASPFGVDAGAVLEPLTNLVVSYKQNRDIRKAIKNAKPALESIRSLVAREQPNYNIIVRRHFILLRGGPDTSTNPSTRGVDEYTVNNVGISTSYALRAIPTLKDVPYGGFVTDPALLRVAKAHRANDLKDAQTKATNVTVNLISALDALIEAHDQALKREPLTLKTVEAFLTPVKEYLALYKALQGESLTTS